MTSGRFDRLRGSTSYFIVLDSMMVALFFPFEGVFGAG